MTPAKQDIELFQPLAPEHLAPGGLVGSGPAASPVDYVGENPDTERCCATDRNRAVFKPGL